MPVFHDIEIIQPSGMEVGDLLDSPLKLKQLTGDIGLDNKINGKKIYRPQLALAGYVGLFSYKQVQLFGHTEYYYLNSLGHEKRYEAFETLCEFPIPCIILTNKQKLEQGLLDIASKNSIPVFNTPFDTTRTSLLLSEVLEDQFAEQAALHGSFVDVYGVGMLFAGRSGIGKSEIALDLIERGHRLVADDVVMLTKKKGNALMGTGTELVKHFMEIRGLGIINIREMFGIRSIRFQKRLEIIVELEEWDPEVEYSRLGMEEDPIEIMGVPVSILKLPIIPGKNITVIAEVIALNYLLKTYGYDGAQEFSQKLGQHIANKRAGKSSEDKRLVTYFQSDDE